MTKQRSLILTFFFLLSCGFLQSQNPFIKLYTTADGLPSNNVWWIVQDHDKFLWFATANGVSQYDGTTFTHYGVSDGLCDNMIVWMGVDMFGRVWFNGLNREHNIFYKNELLDKSEAPFLAKLVNYPFFFQDKDSVMYFYSLVLNKIAMLDINNNVTEFQLPSKPYEKNSVVYEGMRLRHLARSTEGEFMIWTVSGLYKTKDLSEEPVQVATADESHTIYGYTDSTYYDLAHYPETDTTLYIKFVNLHPVDTIKFAEKSMYDVGSIAEGSGGPFWITRSDKGLFCVQDNKEVFHLDIKESYGIIQDHQGYIWAASRNGAYRINPLILKCRHFENSCFKDGLLLDLSSSEGAGVWGINGISAYLYKDSSIYNLDLNDLELPMDRIFALKDNTLIAGDEYYHKFRLSGFTFDRPEKKIQCKNIDRIPVDGQLMINYQQSEFALRHLAKPEDIITFDSSWKVKDTAQADIWSISSYLFYDCRNNLIVNAPQFDLVNQVFRDSKYEPYPELSCIDGLIIKDHITLNHETDLVYTSQETIYLVFQNRKYNLTSCFESPVKAQIKHFIYADTVLFLATERNIFKCDQPLNILEGKLAHFDLIDIDFTSIRDIVLYHDSLFVASDQGLTILPESVIRENDRRPPLPFFQNPEINGKAMPLSAQGIKIKDNERISSGFGYIDYSNTPKNISYMLMGVDEDWITGKSRDITYGMLPAGEYAFKVRTGFAGGSWSESIEYPIIVKRTLLKNPLFYIILTFLLSSLAFLLIIRRKNQVMKRQEIEHQLVTLEQQALQSMMNPHFLFNALGSIQNYLLQNKTREAGRYLSQFARLIRQNIHGLHSAMITLESEIDRLKNYLDLEKMRMEGRFDYKFEIDENIEEDEVKIPTMVTQPFVENCILHGISPLEEGGMIRIVFTRVSEKAIRVMIEDNGVGIVQSQAFKSEKRDHLHLSMEMTRKRIDILGKKFNVKTSLEVTEAFPGNSNPGTRVTIVLPVSYREED